MLHISREKTNVTVSGTVNPGGSKSISNRVLVMRALAAADMPIYNASSSNDTVVLAHLLKENPVEWNVQDAGTAARFSAAFLATRIGEEHILTGTGRMPERPMKPLLDTLVGMGADITYMEKEGFLPVKIRGKKLQGGHFMLPHDVSSQFISALAMIAPFGEQDLTLELESAPLSEPYIQMTLNMLSGFYLHHQVEHTENGGWKLTLYKGTPILPKEYWVENDWSSASYWYAAVALSEDGELLLEGFAEESWQGDALVSSIFDSLGVSSRPTEDGILIRKTENPETEDFEYDFSDHPDLVPTMAVVLPLLGIRSRLLGLQTLRHKESDRVRVIAEGLAALGITCTMTEDGNEMEIAPAPESLNPSVLIRCHGDHRMAMAFSQAISKVDQLTIDTPRAVEKSYPDFWEQMKNVYKTVCFNF